MSVVALILFAIKANGEYINSDDGLKLRKYPTEISSVIDVMEFGDKIKILNEGLGRDYDWIKVKYNGNIGYCHGDYVQTEDPLSSMEYLGNFRVTAYTASGNACANGNYPTGGYTIACNSLEFGTEVFIKGVGFRTVEDRGPSYMGSEWCDLYMDDYDACVQWGSQHRDVYMVGGDDS